VIDAIALPHLSHVFLHTPFFTVSFSLFLGVSRSPHRFVILCRMLGSSNRLEGKVPNRILVFNGEGHNMIEKRRKKKLLGEK